MKIVIAPTLVLLLLYLTIHRTLLFFSFSLSLISQHQNLIAPKFITIPPKSSHLVIFFAVNFIVIAVLLGSSKPHSEDWDWFFSVPTLVYEVEYKEERAMIEDYNYKAEEFVPRLVYIEYKGDQRAKDEHHDDGNDEDNDGFRGYDGYDEDIDGDGSGSGSDVNSEEDDDLECKIEEFIAKVYKKWREELTNGN